MSEEINCIILELLFYLADSMCLAKNCPVSCIILCSIGE